MRFLVFLAISFSLSGGFLQSQTDSVKLFQKRKIILHTTHAAGTIGLSGGLYFAWYKNYPSEHFHFFNDNREWLQMDKAGHIYSTYQLTSLGYSLCRWAGYNQKKSLLHAGISTLSYFSLIEVMDGFSSGWGFSIGDMAANFSGVLIFSLQEYKLKKQAITLKYSFHYTDYPMHRKELLGKNRFEQLIKDYNGQTYWISVNSSCFLPKSAKFPKWLNLAFGYGADGMLSGNNNYVKVFSNGNVFGNKSYRRYLLSLDIDFTKIGVKNRNLKKILQLINLIKIPAPSLELKNGKVIMHPLYY